MIRARVTAIRWIGIGISLSASTLGCGTTNQESVNHNRDTGRISRVDRIARVTGTPLTNESIPSPNNTAEKWNVGGTDLGVIWEMEEGKYGIVFGDTYGRAFSPTPHDPDPQDGSWRCRLLAIYHG